MGAILDKERHVEKCEFRRHVGHDRRNQRELHCAKPKLLQQFFFVAKLGIGIELHRIGIPELGL